jgi:thiosulfate/3-mercaptopyruvate sulfurtransferase
MSEIFPDSRCWHVSCDSGASGPESFNMSTSTVSPPFIDVATLQGLMADAPKLVLLDARFDTAAADSKMLKTADRLPCAIHVDVNVEAAGQARPSTGRLPLPDITVLQRDARRWGIDNDSTIVVYDGGKGSLAARLWWVLRWAGLTQVHILDGGYVAWCAAGGAVTREAGLVRRGSVELSAGHMPTVDAAGAQGWATSGVLLDVRGREAYEGHASQPASGHIPGAYCLPTGHLQGSDGRVKPAAALHELLSSLGVTTGQPAPVAAYCNAGIAAAYTVAALQSAGVPVALYPGSWTEWVKDKARPIAQGVERGPKG